MIYLHIDVESAERLLLELALKEADPDCTLISADSVDNGLRELRALMRSGPAAGVLVITDKASIWICGKRGFTGPGQTEENCSISILSDVGRTVHWQNAFFRQDVVHHGENPFLDLSGISTATNQRHLLAEVDDREVVLTGAILKRNRMEFRCLNHNPIRLKVRQFVFGWVQKHI